jgi:uncharacterized protein YjiS (DUF1127 family)
MYTQDFLKVIGPGDLSHRYRAALLEEARAVRSRAIAAGAAATARWLANAAKELFAAVRTHLRQRANLAELQRLDDRTLADIGLDRSTIYAAARGLDVRAAANSNERVSVAANSNRPAPVRAGTDAA